jgi:hypothetical protein
MSCQCFGRAEDTTDVIPTKVGIHVTGRLRVPLRG